MQVTLQYATDFDLKTMTKDKESIKSTVKEYYSRFHELAKKEKRCINSFRNNK